MGNYYKGYLPFYLKGDIPKGLVHDLYELCKRDVKKENLTFLKDTDWISHERFDCPRYYFGQDIATKSWILEVDFCMKEYRLDGNDLGLSIYKFLKPYLDERYYDMITGGYIGRVYDEDCTYDKHFYVNEEIFNKEMKNRSYICNDECAYFSNHHLCDRYLCCKRAYQLGRESV